MTSREKFHQYFVTHKEPIILPENYHNRPANLLVEPFESFQYGKAGEVVLQNGNLELSMVYNSLDQNPSIIKFLLGQNLQTLLIIEFYTL